MPIRYSELHPEDLQACLDRKAPAVLAWGALEWHGDHLPLGLDGIVSEWFSEHLADNLDGVLLPPVWLPMTTLPHRFSVQISSGLFRTLYCEILDCLADVGFESVIVVTGHYAQGHLWEIFEESVASMARHFNFRVFAGAPLSPMLDNDLLDHAARHETSQMLALRPNLVRFGALDETIEAKRDAVLGEHPALGSEEEGHRLLHGGLEAWSDWFDASSSQSLVRHYAAWLKDLQGYRDKFYRHSWEQAIADWWKTK